MEFHKHKRTKKTRYHLLFQKYNLEASFYCCYIYYKNNKKNRRFDRYPAVIISVHCIIYYYFYNKYNNNKMKLPSYIFGKKLLA